MKLGKNYDILIGTITTEKTTKSNAEKYFFEVVKSATKSEIKEAVETIFNVTVDNINIINTVAKIKRFKGVKGKRSSIKKAIITLKKGQNINFSKME